MWNEVAHDGNTGGSRSTAIWEERLSYWEKAIPAIGPIKRRQPPGILSSQDLICPAQPIKNSTGYSWVLQGSDLTKLRSEPRSLAKLLGVFLILAGVIALVIQRQAPSGGKWVTNNDHGNYWVPLAFIALTGYTLTVFGMKKATLLGFSPPEICLCIYIVNFLFFTFICRRDFRSYFQDKSRLRFFLPVAFACPFFAFGVNLLNVKGIELAPNPAYHEAIRSTNVLFISFLAIPLFPPPLRSGGNAALSGVCLVSPPLRYGENKAHETDALRAPLSAAFSSSMDKQKIMGVISTVVGTFILVI